MLTGLARLALVLALGLVVKAWRSVAGDPGPVVQPLVRCATCWRQRPLGERCDCGDRVTL